MRFPSATMTRLALVCGLGLAATLSGGCNRNVRDENARLKAEVDQLSQANSEKDATIAALQTSRRGVVEPPVDGQEPGNPPGPGGKNRTEREVRLEVAGDVLFDSGSTTIKSSAKSELDKIVSQIKGKYSSHRVRVEGYTDSDPPNKVRKKYPTNEALSQARAEAVENYLVSKGISADRITAAGMGAAKPRTTKKESRRVEIVVLANR